MEGNMPNIPRLDSPLVQPHNALGVPAANRVAMMDENGIPKDTDATVGDRRARWKKV